MLFAFLLLTAPHPAAASPDTARAQTVIVVRHAEKASATERDPSLSDAGKARAAALDSALAGMKVTAIFVTPYKRTAETAALVAKRHGVTPVALDPSRIPAYAAAVADSARAREGVVLIVSHSNTVPAILEALGGARIPDLCEPAFSHLFTVVPGTPAKVTPSRYGAKDPEGADSCK